MTLLTRNIFFSRKWNSSTLHQSKMTTFPRTLHGLHQSKMTTFPRKWNFSTLHGSKMDLEITKSKSLTQVLMEQIQKESNDTTAFICGVTHHTLSRKEFKQKVEKVATSLTKRGFKQGDTILTNSINCFEYPVMYHATSLLGGILSPASPQFSKNELIDQMKIAQPKMMITHSSVKNAAMEAAKEYGISNDSLFCIQNNQNDIIPFETLEDVKNEEIDYPDVKLNPPTDISLLPFSSGTTGNPKGVLLSFSNIFANTMQTCQAETFSDNTLILLPMFHCYASLLMNITLYEKVAGVILPKFDPELFLQTLQTYNIPKVHVAPPIVLFLAKHPLVDQYDLSKTKCLVSGAAPLGPDVEELVRNRLGMQVKQVYGMTELSPCSHYTSDQQLRKGSVGQLIPNTELQIQSLTTGESLPKGEIGEICIRGPQVMVGYKDNEEATKTTIMPDGFLCTGDIGYVDEEGNTYIVDRKKELIKYKGHQIAPAELENLLLSHPDITDAACVRGVDENGEEFPKAYVVLRPQSVINEQQILDYVASHVAPFKKIRKVEFIDVLPKSPTGKILRRILQSRENQSS